LSDHDFHGRLEDRRLITGQGKFASDHNLPGQLYAAFLRSDRAHAVIRGINLKAALAAPGVRAVLTGDDMQAAGLKSLPTQLAVKGRDGAELIKPFRPALAIGKVRFVGETVALVIADTRNQAIDATELIEVDYQELPIVTTAVDSLKPTAPLLHETAPGNRVFDFGQGDEAGADAAMKTAHKVVKLTLHNNRVAASPMEPRAVLASYDPAKDHLDFYSPTQGVNNLRTQLMNVLGLTDDKLDVIAFDVGGGFGVRGNIYPEYPALAVATRKLGKPVKWVSTRAEAMLADEQARDTHSSGMLALDANGKFIGLRFDFVSNLGAYLAPAGPFINMRVSTCFTGVYDVQAAYSRNQLMLTNTAPMAAYRGAGRPIMSAILERLVGAAAIEMGIDPAELRRRNMIPADKFPYSLSNGYIYDSGDPRAVLADAVKASHWDDKAAFEKRRAEAKARGKLLGRGLATAIEPTGAGNFADNVEVKFGGDGQIDLFAVSHSSGQGHETAFAEVVQRILGVPLGSIKLHEGDRHRRVIGNPSGGSRSMHGVGSALHVASWEIVKKGMPLAAQVLEAAEGDIEFDHGKYHIKGTDRSIGFGEIIKRYAGSGALDTNAENKSGSTYPNGAHIAEVEIDAETGEVEVTAYLACDDAGVIINHTLVEGQMHGGLAQGIGQVLGEHLIYDENGQNLTGSYMDYMMPRAGILPAKVTLLDHPVPTPTNPIGVKGVGESGVTGSLPTVMNAILDALAPVGVTHFDMPASSSRVWAAMQAAKAGKPAALAVAQ
jgi:aerobic carbon-monoxide dehydrogenase large subunit